MSAFRLIKLYGDLVTPDGTVCVVYVVAFRMAGVDRGVAGVEVYRSDGSRVVARREIPDAGATIERFAREPALDLAVDGGGLSVRYTPRLGPWRPAPPDPATGLRWRVEVPRGRADVVGRVGGTEIGLEGEGYADRVELERSPRALGLRRIEWARVHAGGTTAVWAAIETSAGSWSQAALWDGAGAEMEPRFIAADGRLRVEGSSVAPAVHPAIDLHPQRILHEGSAFDPERFPGRIERGLWRALAGQVTERRRLLAPAAHHDPADAALHEVVEFA